MVEALLGFPGKEALFDFLYEVAEVRRAVDSIGRNLVLSCLHSLTELGFRLDSFDDDG